MILFPFPAAALARIWISMMCLLSGTGRRRWRVGEKPKCAAPPTSRPAKLDPFGAVIIDEDGAATFCIFLRDSRSMKVMRWKTP
ncbi:hypothetical protein KCP76_25000 [Salmonella enterica subsp. enterica serovar Weltevreden]|nr:hypothetical protein KCP76_25000 [Salmonella enterica subsp. enterica serovar Weltevreden]